MYPAATCWSPFWQTVRSEFAISESFRSTEKIVPTPTAMSRLLEPSRGSKSTQYLPPSEPVRRISGSSSSSEAITAMEPRLPRHRSSTSFAITSSFCWVSPWTFSVPTEPSTSSRRARRTLLAMVFPAREIAEMIHEKSPVALGNRVSSARTWDCREARLSGTSGWSRGASSVMLSLSALWPVHVQPTGSVS